MRACLCVLACIASLAACSTIALNGTSNFALTKSGSAASVSVRVSAQPHLSTGQQFYVTLASNATCTVNVTSNLPFFPRTIVSFPGRRLLTNTAHNGLLETPSLPPSTWKFSIALVNGSCACEFAAIELPTQPLVPGYSAQFNKVDPLGGVFFLYTSSEPFDLRNVTISVPGVACTVTAADSFSYACNYESGTTTTSYNVSLSAGDSLVIPSYGTAAPPTVSGFWPANSTVFIFLQVTGPASSACSAFTVSIADMPPLPLSAHAPPLVISSAASNNNFFAHFIATSPKIPYQLRANYVSGDCGGAEFQWTGNPLVRPWTGQCNPNSAAFIGNEYFLQNQSHYEQPIAGPAGETWVWALFSYFSNNCSLAVSMQ